MSLLSCLKCTTRFAVGLVHCPHCWSEDFEEADGVGKITVAGGASFPEKAPAAAVESEVAVPAAEVVTEPAPPEPEPEPEPEAKPAPSLSRAKDG